MNRAVAIGLLGAGTVSWFFPGFNGYHFEPSAITVGEGRIIGAIFWVGAAIVWFIQPAEK